MNTQEQEALNLGLDSSVESSETVMSCLFCGSDKATGMEIDIGTWAVCCCWCGTIGPHSTSIQIAIARWNSPIERQALP